MYMHVIIIVVIILLHFYSHYQQVETGTHGDEGQGATADDSQGTKESEDERGADLTLRDRGVATRIRKG